jgi:hypothetical protein
VRCPGRDVVVKLNSSGLEAEARALRAWRTYTGRATLEQLDDTLRAGEVHLTAEEAQILDEASAPLVSDYPYGQPGVAQRAREP